MTSRRAQVTGACLPELDRLTRAGIAELGDSGQPAHAVAHGVGAHAHEPPNEQLGSRASTRPRAARRPPRFCGPDGGGLRVEDNSLITGARVRAARSYPDDFRTF